MEEEIDYHLGATGVCIFYIYGPPNTGKTSMLKEIFSSPLSSSGKEEGWDGYKSDPFIVKPSGNRVSIYDGYSGQIPGGTTVDFCIMVENHKPSDKPTLVFNFAEETDRTACRRYLKDIVLHPKKDLI
jgi:hypothetical protein